MSQRPESLAGPGIRIKGGGAERRNSAGHRTGTNAVFKTNWGQFDNRYSMKVIYSDADKTVMSGENTH